MEDLGIEDLKRLRSSLKTKITTAGSRLTGAINKKLVSSLISQFYTELETHYLDFTVADQRYNNELESDRSLVEKYEVVNNLNLTQYTETVDLVELVHLLGLEVKLVELLGVEVTIPGGAVLLSFTMEL